MMNINACAQSDSDDVNHHLTQTSSDRVATRGAARGHACYLAASSPDTLAHGCGDPKDLEPVPCVEGSRCSAMTSTLTHSFLKSRNGVIDATMLQPPVHLRVEALVVSIIGVCTCGSHTRFSRAVNECHMYEESQRLFTPRFSGSRMFV
eukprot:11201754-Lingulodinium_polyedra.AAC.1